MTRVGRVEMDFNQVGPLKVDVYGASFAQKDKELMDTQIVQPGDLFLDFRQQERQLQLKFESNSVGGFFEQGSVLVKLDVGDQRSTQIAPPPPPPPIIPPPPPPPQLPDATLVAALMPVRRPEWPYAQFVVSARARFLFTAYPLYVGSPPVRLPPPTPFPYVATMRSPVKTPLWGIATPPYVSPSKVHVPQSQSTAWPYVATMRPQNKMMAPGNAPPGIVRPQLPAQQPWPYANFSRPHRNKT
jgi:hypothetical protein